MMKNMIIPVLLLFALAQVYAGDTARLGTTSGSQLLIPIGARAISMGGAAMGDISGAEAIYWNPAGVSHQSRNEVLFSNMQYIADIDVNYLGMVYNGGILGSFAFHINSLDFGDIQETTEFAPDGTGNTYSPSFIVAGVTYSRLLTDRINVGVTGKVVSESIQETNASTIALDLGVQYEFNSNIRLGVVMKNVGGKMRYDGRNLERQFEIPGNNPLAENGFFRGSALASDIPSIFSFGLSYHANINEENRLIFNGAFTNQNDASDLVYGGLEYNFNDFFYLRGGYGYEAQSSEDQIFGGAFGAGFQVPLGNFNFKLDYAFRELTEYFDANNVFTVKLGF